MNIRNFMFFLMLVLTSTFFALKWFGDVDWSWWIIATPFLVWTAGAIIVSVLYAIAYFLSVLTIKSVLTALEIYFEMCDPFERDKKTKDKL